MHWGNKRMSLLQIPASPLKTLGISTFLGFCITLVPQPYPNGEKNGTSLSEENEAPKIKKSQAFDVSLHPVCGVFPHLFRNMSIDIQCECDGGMSQIL